MPGKTYTVEFKREPLALAARDGAPKTAESFKSGEGDLVILPLKAAALKMREILFINSKNRCMRF